MGINTSIFRVSASVEDYRPQIDFDARVNRGIDWRLLDDILQGRRCSDDYRELTITMTAADVAQWHYFVVPGTLGLISKYAIERIGRPAFRHYQLLRAWLNGEDFYFLKCLVRLPCLDRDKSVIIPFRNDPGQVKDIKVFAFNKGMISDPLCFSIPELDVALFATASVQQTVERAGLFGFRFTNVDG